MSNSCKRFTKKNVLIGVIGSTISSSIAFANPSVKVDGSQSAGGTRAESGDVDKPWMTIASTKLSFRMYQVKLSTSDDVCKFKQGDRNQLTGLDSPSMLPPFSCSNRKLIKKTKVSQSSRCQSKKDTDQKIELMNASKRSKNLR